MPGQKRRWARGMASPQCSDEPSTPRSDSPSDHRAISPFADSHTRDKCERITASAVEAGINAAVGNVPWQLLVMGEGVHTVMHFDAEPPHWPVSGDMVVSAGGVSEHDAPSNALGPAMWALATIAERGEQPTVMHAEWVPIFAEASAWCDKHECVALQRAGMICKPLVYFMDQ
jgi:hypothetical protein